MNEEVKLEIALEEDAEKIRDIMVKIFEDEKVRWSITGDKLCIPGHNSIDMQKYHTWDNKYYKIIYNKIIIGVTLISHTGREHGRIDRLYILPEYQGMKLGTKVLKGIEEIFPMVTVWSLDTIKESPRNHQFYEKNGYKLTSEDEAERYYCKVIHESTYVSDKYWSSKDLSDCNFRKCNIQAADLYDTNMSKCTFTNMDLSGNIYFNSNLSNNRYTNLNLSNSVFGDSNMSKVEICHSSLSEAYIHDINLDVETTKAHIIMERCDLTNSKIIHSNLQDVKIENCNIDGMSINGIEVLDMLEYYKMHKLVN